LQKDALVNSIKNNGPEEKITPLKSKLRYQQRSAKKVGIYRFDYTIFKDL